MHAYLTHPEWPPLLAAIRATPDDDLPRLVAADWLDEHGCGERAESIRTGCEMARLARQKKSLTLRFDDLRQRVSVLSAKLFPSLSKRPATPHALRLFFDRGFVTEVECPFDWWASRADVVVPEGVSLAVRIGTMVEWEDHPEGAPTYRLVGREEVFGEMAVLTASERQPSTAAALCALTWPTVAKWSVNHSHRRARPLVTPPTLAARDT